jgi:glycosyltransferase involved in cell wall biosynthesis
MNPLVSVIAVCYNHERFVRDALTSVVQQTYDNIELIVVDDASTDGSARVIQSFVNDHPNVDFIIHTVNKGNCATFNSGFARAKGDFVIDLATDDILLPERIATGVAEFQRRDLSWGVQYTDARFIDEDGKPAGYHSDKYPHRSNPDGDIYRELVTRYFVCSPTMMIRTEVLRRLNGYDESLAYEDFDFWIRSSRDFRYFYTPHAVVLRRLVKGSMSDRQFRRGNLQQESTFKVCEKILALNRSEEERQALNSRIGYELRQAISRGDLGLAMKYVGLRRRNS